MAENIKLVLCSFAASYCYGIIYQMERKDLVWAGVGGALTRCCYLILLGLIDQRFVYSLLAAGFSALYAEIMALYKKMPSTVFLYPAIIPLLPGSLLYHTAVSFISNDTAAMMVYARNCGLTLAGISLGFVIISTFTYYRRIYFISRNFAQHLLHSSQTLFKSHTKH